MTFSKENSMIFDIFIEKNISMEVKPKAEQIVFVKPDEDYDFHAYRLLLLIFQCGVQISSISTHKLIYGKWKFAFYDFLIRHPYYLEKLIEVKSKGKKQKLQQTQLNLKPYEKSIAFSEMSHYIRGPWDHNYFNIFAYMSSKDLIVTKHRKVTESGENKLCISLTDLGLNLALKIASKELEWVNRTGLINELFPSNTSDNAIQKLIDDKFPELKIGL